MGRAFSGLMQYCSFYEQKNIPDHGRHRCGGRARRRDLRAPGLYLAHQRNYSPVSDLVSNSNARYNAISFQVHRRGRKGLQFFGSFTWAKAIDYGPGNKHHRGPIRTLILD